MPLDPRNLKAYAQTYLVNRIHRKSLTLVARAGRVCVKVRSSSAQCRDMPLARLLEPTPGATPTRRFPATLMTGIRLGAPEVPTRVAEPQAAVDPQPHGRSALEARDEGSAGGIRV